MRAILSLLITLALVAIVAVVLDQTGVVDLPLQKVPGLAGFNVDHSTTTTGSAASAEPSSDRAIPAAAKVTPTKPKPTPAPAVIEDDKYAKQYPLPPIKSIDQILSNWTKFPPSAFPRKVTLTKAVAREIKSADGKVIGSTKVQPGTELVALGVESGKLRLAADEKSKAHSLVAMDDTDFKTSMSSQYDEFKKKVTNQILAKRETARRRDSQLAKAAASGASAPPPPTIVSAVPTSDPRFKPMIDSIKNGNYTELNIENITGWSWIGPMEVEGRTYDVGMVNFKSQTIFGELDTEAMALIAGNRVEKWLYSGSREEVQ